MADALAAQQEPAKYLSKVQFLFNEKALIRHEKTDTLYAPVTEDDNLIDTLLAYNSKKRFRILTITDQDYIVYASMGKYKKDREKQIFVIKKELVEHLIFYK
ncbi:hypothetical protein GCM10022246_24530 [Pedobacter ginsengiterrae]|uniref:Uncharacterized protein n=2 Tax=Pedobacter ginsengiterrae TaxID=871696 RepID=A0ABP7PTK8_9SPHI